MTNENIKDTLNTSTKLAQLIISENRHDLSNFLYEVTFLREAGYLNGEDFELFRNGFAVETVLNLKKLLNRDLQTSELLDKINYLSIVPDAESLIKTFTNKTLLEGVKDEDHELGWWFGCGTLDRLPIEVKGNIAEKLLDMGAYDKAKTAIASANKELKYKRENPDKVVNRTR